MNTAATIEVILLGTGSPLPDADRAGPSTLVRTGGHAFLFDAGRGVGLRLAAAGQPWSSLSAVFLTHLHSDHITDLNDVVTSRWVTSFTPNPLRVYGPRDTTVVVDGLLAMLQPDISYRLAHHADLTEGPEVTAVEVSATDDELVAVFDDPANGVRVLAAPTDHRPVEPTLGYRVESGGRSVVIGGDGVPCAGLERLCNGADAYVQTVLRDDLVRAVPFQRFVDTIDYHSTPQQAGAIAAGGGVATLILTHPIPAPAPGTEPEWIAAANQTFDGEVILGSDLTRVVLG